MEVRSTALSSQDRGGPVHLGDTCDVVDGLGGFGDLAAGRADGQSGMFFEVDGQRPRPRAI
jgi:hypothetical protein